MTASTWTWAVLCAGRRLGGRVNADNARDAVAKALTTQSTHGNLLGDELSVPAAVLHDAPADASNSYTAQTTSLRLVVSKLSSSAGHPDLQKPAIRLKCTCCGAPFQGRQFFNQDTGHGLGDCCLDYVIPRTQDLEATYGINGVHFGLADATVKAH